MKQTVVWVIALILSYASVAGYADERIEPVFDQRKWVVGYREKLGNESIAEYVPEGQSVRSWSELVTVYSNRGPEKDTPIHDYVVLMKIAMHKTCGEAFWDIISESETEVFYEWSVSGCPRAVDQTEIGRAITGKEAVHLIRYTVKDPRADQAHKEKWFDILNEAKLVS